CSLLVKPPQHPNHKSVLCGADTCVHAVVFLEHLRFETVIKLVAHRVDTHASHRNVNRLDTFRHHRLKAGTLFTVSGFEDVSTVSPPFTLTSLSSLLSRSCSSWSISLLHLMI
ncbi:hypothetical protein HID58_067890, partial [Brassica napus]